MYRPDEGNKKVVTMFAPKEKDEDPYYTVGIWTGKTGEHGEHYLIEFVFPFDETQYIHYEDLYEPTNENREKIPDRVSLFL